ncbi:MAG: STAS domain-containing protein [Chthoniobacteraceae bacterium]|nr:STAS domain-containing protein [Chthoniobacteraceae bacterium]
MAVIFVAKRSLLVLRGEIDKEALPRLKAGLWRLLRRRPSWLLVDLSQVTFIGSPGLAVLIQARQYIQAYGGRLALFGLREAVRTVFHLARLDLVFRIFPDQEAAARAVEAVPLGGNGSS